MAAGSRVTIVALKKKKVTTQGAVCVSMRFGAGVAKLLRAVTKAARQRALRAERGGR